MKRSLRILLSVCLLLTLALMISACSSDLRSHKMEEMTILLDPGHGDSDVGTIGPVTGVYEKDINLAITLKLKAALEEKGATIVMTRETDEPLGPADEQDVSVRKENDMTYREQLIAGANANLMLSIHQNAFEDPSIRGPQMFYLQYNNQSYGVALSETIQDAVNRELQIENPRHVSCGNWRLLKQGGQPGCIVECGFFTNPEEELLLQDEAYQDRMVQAIVKGVEEYVKRYGA